MRILRLLALAASAAFLLALAPPTGAEGAQIGTIAPPAPWSWPLSSRTPVLRPFDPPARPWLPGHRGVDLDAPLGSIVLAPAHGRVVWAGELAGRPLVSIAHGPIRSTFEPLRPLVDEGALVERGTPIGVVIDGHSPGTLHWGAKVSAEHYLDPLRLLVGPVGLKPWDGG